ISKTGRVPGDGSNRSHAKSHDHIARIWPDRGVDCRSVADYCAYRLVCSAFQAVAGRGHDGIRGSHSGRDGGHRFIELEGPAATGITHPADTAGDVLMSAYGTKQTSRRARSMLSGVKRTSAKGG